MQDPIRIIAWGNRGRCDDGVALVLAERLQRRYADDAEVCIQQYHQLGPELVDDLSRSRLAIFLDAHLREDRDEVFMERVEPREAAGLNTHHCHPPVLLALGRSMRFRVPEAYMVCVRGRNFDFGDRLSEATERAMLEAEQIVIKLITSGKGVFQGRVQPMHELPIAIEIVRQAVEVAGKHEADRIEEVEVQVGAMRQIVSEALEMSFAAASEGTLAEGARLRVIEEKVVAVCRYCECLFLPEPDNFMCPRCGRADARIVAGNDIILKSVVCHAATEAAVS